MIDDLLRPTTLLIVLAVVVLLFGATRLPALARSLGQSRNAFRAEMKKGAEADKAESTEAKPVDPTSTDEATNTDPKP